MRGTGGRAFLSEVVSRWQRHNSVAHGAALAYYTLFSLTPLLVLLIIVAGLVLGRAAAHGAVFARVQGLVGADGARTVEDMVQRASTPRAGIVPTVLSFGAMVFGASGLVGQLRSALNTVWEAPARRGGGVRALVRERLVILGVIAGMGALLLASFVLSAVLAGAQEVITGYLPLLGPLLPGLDAGVSIVVALGFFALIFRFLPDVEVSWSDVAFGAAITALLFTAGKWLIGLYLGRAGAASIYGAAGSLVLLLLWVYYSAQILLFGAELTATYARRRRGYDGPDAG